jgi:putative ABC transport system permease protein
MAIVVGVATFGDVLAQEPGHQCGETFLATDPASGILYTADFGEELLDAVRGVEGVADVNARRVVVIKMQSGQSDWETVELHMISDFGSLSVGKLIYEPDSQAPPPQGTFLLERSALALFDIRTGDGLPVRLPGGETAQLSIAGLANDLSLIPSSAIPIGYAYVTVETMKSLGQPTMYNRLYVRVVRELTSRAEVERVIAEVAAKVENEGVAVQRSFVPNPWETPFESSANTALLLLASLGTLSLGLSAFLVINIMSAVVTEQMRQIGVIKSLGGKSPQLIGLYLQMVLIFGLLALVIAVPAALLGAYFLANFTARQLDVDIVTFTIPPRVLLLQIVSGVLPLLAALIPFSVERG